MIIAPRVVAMTMSMAKLRRHCNRAMALVTLRCPVSTPTPLPDPAVSVLVPCYRDGPYIQAALESVLSQDWEDFEVVVSDEGVDPDCQTAVNAIDDPRLRYFRNPERLGMNRNWNTALERSRGALVIKLDADDVMTPGTLRRLVDALIGHNTAGAAACLSRRCDEQLAPGELYGTRGFALAHREPLADTLFSPEDIFPYLFDDVQFWTSCSLLFRRESLVGLKGWDERWQASDTDLILRLFLAGHSIAHCGHVGILYRERQGSENSTARLDGGRFLLENALLHLEALQYWHRRGQPVPRPLGIAWYRYWRRLGDSGSALRDAEPALKASAAALDPPPMTLRSREWMRLQAHRLLHGQRRLF